MTMQFGAPRPTGGERLPPYATPVAVLARSLPALAPPARVTVSEAAERYRRIDTLAYRGPWRNKVAPYMVEPMDMLTSRRFNAVVFVGPARSAKTDALIVNPVVHGVVCHPRTMTIVHMSRDSARDFSLEKLDGLIRATPAVRERLVKAAGADNIFDKRFAAGMRLSIAWPVVSKLSARDIPFIALSDYDRMDDDIGEEGDPFSLARKRTQTFGTLGMTVVESSPGRPILDEDWRPASRHEAPPAGGALGLYNRGTRARWYWTCPGCGEDFEPTFATLTWPDAIEPASAAAGAAMACPHCGTVIEPEHKSALNAVGRWRHEGAAGELVTIDGETRPAGIVSYWLPGPAAAFQAWSEIVQRFLEAKLHFDRTGDEAPLKATTNLDQGSPYLPRARSSIGDLTEDALRARAERYPLRIAPEATRFVTMQIDVQKNRFVVQVDAWGVGLERWLIDRFELHTPPDDAPGAGARALDPARYAEDWAVITDLLRRAYPVAGSGRALVPVAIALDMHGAPGVTDNAYRYWREANKVGLGRRIRLVRGEGGLGPGRRRAYESYPDAARPGNKALARDVPIIRVGTDRLKDEIAASLTRDDAGPGAYHLPDAIDPAVFLELTAERRGDKGWSPKAGRRSNEALDLAVYGKALVIVLDAEKFDWERPKNWALPVVDNVLAVDIAEVDEGFARETVLTPPVRRRRFPGLRRRRVN